MKLGDAMIVSSGMGEFKAFFIRWLDEADKILCQNRFGQIITISQYDVLEVFV